MIKTLRRRFIITTILSTLIALLILIGAINIWNYIKINKEIDIKLDILINNQGEFDSFEDKPLESILNDHKPKDFSKETPYNTRYFYIIYDSQRHVEKVDVECIASYSEQEAIEMVDDLIENQKNEGFVEDYKYRKSSFVDQGELKTICIVLNCEREFVAFRQFLLSSISFSIAGLMLVTFLAIIFSNRVVKPIAESYAKQKRFITDASHEIKTPLTIIDANTEIIEMDTGESEWTQSIHKQIKNLTDLTNKLVFLSRMDEENLNLEMHTINLSELIVDSLEGYEALSFQKNHKINSRITPNIQVQGNQENLARCIGLLMDNAIKYAKKDTAIQVILEKNSHQIVLRFINEVEDMKDGNYDQLFDRFYRLDASRNSKTGGHGVGLSVVQAIISAHKGKIHATCKQQQFEIQIIF